jgi:hypothetical protein
LRVAADLGTNRTVKRVRAGAMRALVAADVDLAAITGPDHDPDRLVTSSRCTLRKFQAKVVVGRIETVRGWVWVKRYNVWSLRVALASLGRRSPAAAAFANAQALAARGFAVPAPLAAVEYRRAGVLRRSFFLTDEVAHAETADVAWRRILALTDGPGAPPRTPHVRHGRWARSSRASTARASTMPT